jgi:hypothetical protein
MDIPCGSGKTPRAPQAKTAMKGGGGKEKGPKSNYNYGEKKSKAVLF